MESEKQEANQGLRGIYQSPTFEWEVGTMFTLKPYLAMKVGMYAWGKKEDLLPHLPSICHYVGLSFLGTTWPIWDAREAREHMYHLFRLCSGMRKGMWVRQLTLSIPTGIQPKAITGKGTEKFVEEMSPLKILISKIKRPEFPWYTF